LTIWIWISTLVAALAVGYMLALTISTSGRRRAGGRRNRRGRAGEAEAADLLREMGFEILEHNPSFAIDLRVDESVDQFQVTPDFLVSLDGTEYVVEVKTTEQPSSIHQADIRRQVIEYLLASGKVCLLVDAVEGRIQAVDLTSSLRPGRPDLLTDHISHDQ